MIKRLQNLWKDESGISAIEYALIASGIALAIMAAVDNLSDAVSDKFQAVADKLNEEAAD